ncbi:MAG TPA: HAMP domain-containing sensor histidine kinase [Rudaea sp.]|jgi:signal transduction histidine kinase
MTEPDPARRGNGLSERWRSSTVRLLAIYGAFFLLWSIVLVATISWQTTQFLDRVVGEILEQRVSYLASIDRDHLPAMMSATNQLDLRGVMLFGLFDRGGAYLSGNIDRPPQGLPPDGQIHRLEHGLQTISGERNARALGVAVRLQSGDMLVLARYTGVADRIGAMTRSALGWALSLLLIPGLIGGFLLSRGPSLRVRRIETAIEPIMRGDLGARLPVSDRRDEVDMLATIVNRMLGRIEHLLGEVKGVSDSIAHDLRTPLTRLRAQLYRLQTQSDPADPRSAVLERCIVDTDALLDRFRALLRISELEDMRRRAGFGTVDLADTLRRVHELYVPLAEDKGVALTLAIDQPPAVHADQHLLIEALSNLVANAIKFTPGGGKVELRAARTADGARIDVRDNGPGIPLAERSAVLQRFYRSDCGRDAAGFGLGLSIVSAIIKLHDFRLEISANEPHGACLTIHCWPQGEAVTG